MRSYMKLFAASFVALTFCGTAFAKSTIQEIGDYTQVLVPLYALALTLNEENGEGTKQLIYSFAATQATVEILKAAVDAPRPDGSDSRSFPSGHAASAFSGATFIHKRYGFQKAIIPYLLAGFTGYSRVYANRHYTRDVVASALISGLYTWLFVDEYNPGPLQVSVGPGSIRLAYVIDF